MTDLVSAKTLLVDCLRDKTQIYWDVMKSWYRRKITKEDFDTKAKALLGENNVHLHNEFLFAILVKCQTGGATPEIQSIRQSQSASPMHPSPLQPPAVKRPKVQKPKILVATEVPYGALESLQYHSPPTVQVFKDLDSILLCSHELVLPDVSTLHARMLLGAWEAELNDVTEECAKVLLHALKVFMKNVIQEVIAHRISWKVHGRSFQHSFGNGGSLMRSSVDNPRLPSRVQTVLSQYTRGERGEAESMARLAPSVDEYEHKDPITLFHMRDALLVNPQCIPVHSIYTCNMERIVAGMWHQSEEEEEQQRTVEQWQRSKYQQTPFSISTTS